MITWELMWFIHLIPVCVVKGEASFLSGRYLNVPQKSSMLMAHQCGISAMMFSLHLFFYPPA